MKKKVIVTVSKTYQTTEDTWQRATLTGLFDESEPIKDVLEWVKSKDGDINTISVHIDNRD